MTSSTMYQTAILATKKEAFLEFVRELKIKEKAVNFFASSGDYLIYNIDLSGFSSASIHEIRQELSFNQPSFL